MRAWPLVALLLTAAWAGCVDRANDDLGPAEAGSSAQATGFLRGVVIDETIRPIEGAIVNVLHNGTSKAELSTDADGKFGMGNLAAGNYTLNVTKPGFLARQVPARVTAGEHTPDLLPITLIPVPVDSSFVWPIVWQGQITCGTTFQNWCAAINLVTGIQIFDDESFRFLFDEFMAWQRTPDFLQVEFVWEANNELSKYAYAGFWASTWDEWNECLCTPNILALEEGPEYILVQVERAPMEEHDVGFTKGIGVGLSAGSGAGDVEAVAPEKVSVMVNQPFEAFMHAFYGCLPPQDWRFTLHGEPECDPNSLAAAADANV